MHKTGFTLEHWRLCDNIFLGNVTVYLRFLSCMHTETTQVYETIPDRTLKWRHNVRHSVSNYQHYDCSLNRLFGRRSKKTSKLHVTGLCAGIHRWPVNSLYKWPVTRKMFPFDDVIMDKGLSISYSYTYYRYNYITRLLMIWRCKEPEQQQPMYQSRTLWIYPSKWEGLSFWLYTSLSPIICRRWSTRVLIRETGPWTDGCESVMGQPLFTFHIVVRAVSKWKYVSVKWVTNVYNLNIVWGWDCSRCPLY